MDGELVFLLFGKLKPYKGLDLLIEAFAQMPPPLQARARVRAVGKPYMDLAPLLARAEALGVGSRVSIEPRFVADSEIPALSRRVPWRPFRIARSRRAGFCPSRSRMAGPFWRRASAGSPNSCLTASRVPWCRPATSRRSLTAMARFVADRGFAAECARNVRALAASIPDWTEIGRRTADLYTAAIRGDGAGRRAA